MSASTPTLFAAALTACASLPTTQAAARPDIRDLPVLFGSEKCDGPWNGGAVAVCRRVGMLHIASVLHYPAAVRALGWTEVEPGYGQGEEGFFDTAPPIWFERAVDANCSERLSMSLLPGPPDHSDATRDVALIFRTDYAPVCGATRQAQ